MISAEDNMAKYYSESARKASQKYLLKNCLSVSFRLNRATEPELIEIYQQIPNSQKAEVFKQAIRDWAERQKEDL